MRKPWVAVLACFVLVSLCMKLKASDAQEVPWETSTFCKFVPEFVEAWESKELGNIDALIDPATGFWVIYNLGVADDAFEFSKIGDALAKGAYGFGFLGAVGFGDCQPESGAVPRCRAEGVKGPLCRFGKTEPDFLTVFEDSLRFADGKSERDRRLKELNLLTQAVKGGVYFLSDQHWGATFYFVRHEDRWRLVVIDTSDCSA